MSAKQHNLKVRKNGFGATARCSCGKSYGRFCTSETDETKVKAVFERDHQQHLFNVARRNKQEAPNV